jgi:LmbE family N-acetylglucosaminyl deacetylase
MRLLYVLPHADDELFVAGLLVANAGQPQTVVWLTHGGWMPRLRAGERRRTAALLARRFGVVSHWLELPDGDLDGARESAVAALERLADDETVVVTTEPEGEHGDHDAAFELCERLASGRRLVTVPCYDRGWRWRRRVGVPADGEGRWLRRSMGKGLAQLRLRLAWGYPSQWVFLLPMLASGGAGFLTTQFWREALAEALAAV